MTELWGAYKSLKYARRLSFSVVELHVDLSVVVQMLSKGGWDNRCGRSLVMKFRRLLEMKWESVVHHSCREANQCVNALANLGYSLGSNMMVFETCPSQFSHLVIVDDVMGIVTPRLVVSYISHTSTLFVKKNKNKKNSYKDD